MKIEQRKIEGNTQWSEQTAGQKLDNHGRRQQITVEDPDTNLRRMRGRRKNWRRKFNVPG